MLISRQAAIDALCDNCDNPQAVCAHYPCKQYTAIEALPSAQTERKKGKWIRQPIVLTSRPPQYVWKCSICGEEIHGFMPLSICTKCGAFNTEEESI